MEHSLPAGEHKFYVGIDPGYTGSLARINAKGTTVVIEDLPTTGTGKAREFDLGGLHQLFRTVNRLPDPVLGIEWPTTRPGEGAERAERFGRGKGYLHAIAHLVGLDYHLIAPNLWKGRLGVPGKAEQDANKIAAQLFDSFYPDFADLIRGPRGGLKDGRIDAALIAHFLRQRSVEGHRTIAERFGKDSDQAWSLILGAGSKGRKKRVRFS